MKGNENERFKKCIGALKIVIIKIGLGVLDVASDVTSAFNLLSGEFALGLYFASQTRELYDNAPDVEVRKFNKKLLFYFFGKLILSSFWGG